MTALPPWGLDVSPELMFVMADLLDDPNPIHLDPDATRRMGLGDRVINQGPTNCGYVVSMLQAAYPGGELVALRLRLGAQVKGGDRVTAGGRVTGEHDGLVDCEVWLDVEGGARAVEGTATVRPASAGT